jgi:hypothetical protein
MWLARLDSAHMKLATRSSVITMGEMGYRELRRRVRWVLVLRRWDDALVVGGSVGDAVSGAEAWRVVLFEAATL